MAKEQNQNVYQRTIWDELEDGYKEKLAAAEKQIKDAEEQVASDEAALNNNRVPKNELPELQNDLRWSQQALSEAEKQRDMILTELQDLEK